MTAAERAAVVGFALLVLGVVSLLVAAGADVVTNSGNAYWLTAWVGWSLLGIAVGIILAIVGMVWSL